MTHLSTQREAFKPKFDAMENAMIALAAKFPVECPTVHRFTDGLYIREIHIPAGTLLTSLTHRTNHPFVVTKGTLDLCDECGAVERITAPHIGITFPGARRVIAAITDVVWITFHATEVTDPDTWVAENTFYENQSAPADFLPGAFLDRRELPCPR